MKNSKEPCKFPHSFFQNSSPFLLQKLVHLASLGFLLMASLVNHWTLFLMSHLLIKKNLRKKDSTNSVDPLFPKDSPLLSVIERVLGIKQSFNVYKPQVQGVLLSTWGVVRRKLCFQLPGLAKAS